MFVLHIVPYTGSGGAEKQAGQNILGVVFAELFFKRLEKLVTTQEATTHAREFLRIYNGYKDKPSIGGLVVQWLAEQPFTERGKTRVTKEIAKITMSSCNTQ